MCPRRWTGLYFDLLGGIRRSHLSRISGISHEAPGHYHHGELSMLNLVVKHPIPTAYPAFTFDSGETIPLLLTGASYRFSPSYIHFLCHWPENGRKSEETTILQLPIRFPSFFYFYTSFCIGGGGGALDGYATKPTDEGCSHRYLTKQNTRAKKEKAGKPGILDEEESSHKRQNKNEKQRQNLPVIVTVSLRWNDSLRRSRIRSGKKRKTNPAFDFPEPLFRRRFIFFLIISLSSACSARRICRAIFHIPW